MNSIAHIAEQYLKSKNYHFPDGWVEACLEFLKEEHNDSLHEFQNSHWLNLIEQQWCHADLRDFEIPTSLKLTCKVFKFQGVSCCQVMSFIDISKSMFHQWQESLGMIKDDNICSDEADLTQFHGKSTRCLHLNLTDGVNNFKAIEFEHWPSILNKMLVPGCKVKLMGPFVIRNQVALLKSCNIQFLGGEVEELTSQSITTNYCEEQLKINRSLADLPLINNPKYESRIKQEHVRKECKTEATKIPIKGESNLPSNRGEPNKPFTTMESNVVSNRLEPNKPVSEMKIEIIPNNINNESIFDQEMLIDDDDDDNVNNNNNNNNNDNSIEEEYDDEFEAMVNDVDFEDDEFGNNNHVANMDYVSPIDVGKSNYETPPSIKTLYTNRTPFTYLSIIERDLLNQSPQPFYKIKGLFMRYISMLTVRPIASGKQLASRNYEWLLRVSLNDGASSLDSRIDDGFISRQLGFSADVLHNQKQSSIKGGSEVAILEQYRQRVIDFQKYLVSCNCGIFTLTYIDSCDGNEDCDSEAEPDLAVTNYEPFDDALLNLYKERIDFLYP